MEKRRVVGQGDIPDQVVQVLQEAPEGPYMNLENIPKDVLLASILPKLNPFWAMRTWRGRVDIFGGATVESRLLWRKYLEKSRLFDPLRYIADSIVGTQQLERDLANHSKNIFLWLFYWSRRWARTRAGAGVRPIPVMDVVLGEANAISTDLSGKEEKIFITGFRNRYGGLPPNTQGLAQLQILIRWSTFLFSERDRANMDMDLFNNLDDPVDMLYKNMSEWKLYQLGHNRTGLNAWDVWTIPDAYKGIQNDERYRARIEGLMDEVRRFRQMFNGFAGIGIAWTFLLNNYPRHEDGMINVGCKMCPDDNPQYRCSNCHAALCGQECLNTHTCSV